MDEDRAREVARAVEMHHPGRVGVGGGDRRRGEAGEIDDMGRAPARDRLADRRRVADVQRRKRPEQTVGLGVFRGGDQFDVVAADAAQGVDGMRADEAAGAGDEDARPAALDRHQRPRRPLCNRARSASTISRSCSSSVDLRLPAQLARALAGSPSNTVDFGRAEERGRSTTCSSMSSPT